MLDLSDIYQDEFLNIQDWFYALAAKVGNIVNIANTLDAGTSSHES